VQAAFDATLKTIATRCRAFFVLPFGELSPADLKAELARIAQL
jgi:arsenate reductase